MSKDDWRLRGPTHCAAAFSKISWALVFFFDIRIGINGVRVDLLPDFVGWWMMASALELILDLAFVVRTLRTLVHWLVFLSLFDLVEVSYPIAKYGEGTVSISACFPIGLITAALAMVAIWKLCGLIMELAIDLHEEEIWRRASFRRKAYLIWPVTVLAGVLATGGITSLALPLFVVGFAIDLTLACLMIGLMAGAAQMCDRHGL